jgi:hypothetical protein
MVHSFVMEFQSHNCSCLPDSIGQSFATAVASHQMKIETVGDVGDEGTTSGHAARILSFTDSSLAFPFVGSPDHLVKKLFIRYFYDPLIDDVMKCFQSPSERLPHVIICGNPGIGKSTFGIYLLFRALKLGRPVVYQQGMLSGACFLFENGTVTKHASSSSHVIENRLYDPRVLFIVDSYTPIATPDFKCITILVTSPLPARYKEYQKQMQADTMRPPNHPLVPGTSGSVQTSRQQLVRSS